MWVAMLKPKSPENNAKTQKTTTYWKPKEY